MFEIPVRKDEALKYLEEKYHETFSLHSSTTVSIDQPYGELFFFPASHPSFPVRVYDDLKSFSDNYFGFLIQEPIQSLLDEAAGSDGRIFFHLTAAAFPDSFRDPAELKALMQSHPSCFWMQMTLFLADTDGEKELRFSRVCDRLKAAGITGVVTGYLLKAEELPRLSPESASSLLTGPEALTAFRTAVLRSGEE